jgi:hypothetical protein
MPVFCPSCQTDNIFAGDDQQKMLLINGLLLPAQGSVILFRLGNIDIKYTVFFK